MSPILQSLANGSARGYGAFSVAAAASDFESIATTTLSTNTATITLSSIPQTYTHLQLRVLARTTRSAGPDILGLYMNGSTANDYADHLVYGDGANPLTDFNINYPQINIQRLATTHSGTSIFSGMIIDILDYTNTNKFKTVRYLSGFDANGSGRVGLGSGLWRSTNAITSLNIFSLFTENYVANSQFALYGIRSA